LEKVIHIGTGLDRNYLKPFLALVSSLVKHHARNQFKIHAIATGLLVEEKQQITKLVAKSGNEILFYETDPGILNSYVLSNQWTSSVYYRLCFSSILPEEVSRLLYLDCDTLVVSSLLALYQSDLDGYPVAAVYDNYVRSQPLIGIFEEGDYFNSGVLLMDLKEWRQQTISEKTFEYLRSYPERICYVDQCALNAVLKGNWKKLDSRFNLMYSILPGQVSRREMNDILKGAVIIHFTLQRPWQMLCRNRFRYLFFKYLAQAGTSVPFWNYYSDFEVRKIPEWLTIRATELYFDAPVIQRIWRSLKAR